jgi:hypothetical protein
MRIKYIYVEVLGQAARTNLVYIIAESARVLQPVPVRFGFRSSITLEGA